MTIDAAGFNQFDWLNSFNGKINLVYPIPRIQFSGSNYALPSVGKIEEHTLQAAKRSLEKMCRAIGGNIPGQTPGISVSEDSLLKKVAKTQSDLIILNRERKGFDSFFKKILRSLPCDVLIMKR